MKYKHHWLSGDQLDLPCGKIVCVGRNYAEHARELDNPIPDDPVLFIKPSTSLVALEQPLLLPEGQGAVHYETEIALLIGRVLCKASEQEGIQAIKAFGLALDLTLRDVQSQLKSKGLPWETAKGFDGSCPVSSFVAREHIQDVNKIAFSMKLNGKLRQQGNSTNMLASIPGLLSHISRHFTLEPGDLVLTGTPVGVGPLSPGDRLDLALTDRYNFSTVVSTN